jgi:peptidoglycan/LPS O-acetylase OafA/YrhL
VEIRFYIIYPFLAFLLAFVLRHLNAWTLILIGLPLSMASSMVYPVLGNQNALPLFLCGVLASLAYKNSTLKEPSKVSRVLEKKANMILIILFVLYLVMILSTEYLIENTFEVFWSRSWYLAPFVAGLVFFTAISTKGLASVFSHPFARWTGRISFSLYLLHKFAIYIVVNYFPKNFQNLFVSLILIFLIAIVFYFIIERPFAILARKINSKELLV